jgi:RsiW-degrading membrane proteinase PrsW (M82 family)
MPILLSAVLIAIPTFLYAWIVRNVDRLEKEPTKYLIATFVWGAVPSVMLALVLGLIFSVPTLAIFGEDSPATAFINTAIQAPIVEEIVKGLAVGMIYLWRRREFDGWIDGIVYGSTVGFGFAYVENILYLAQTSTIGEWGFLFVMRVLALGFMHGFWTSLTGIGFGVARNRSSDFVKALCIATGLAFAIAGHAIHNGMLTLSGIAGDSTFTATLLGVACLNYAVVAALMIGLGVIGRRDERAVLSKYLRDEVPDVLSEEQYRVIVDHSRESATRLGLNAKAARALQQLASELALKKRQNELNPSEPGLTAIIMQLRGQLSAGRPVAAEAAVPTVEARLQ